MARLKIFVLLLALSGFFLPGPHGIRAEEPSSTSTSGSPFSSTQGEVSGGIINYLFHPNGQNQTPGFGPVLNMFITGLFTSALGANTKPIFMQNNQDLGAFISGLQNQSPAQLQHLFTHDLMFNTSGGEAPE